MILVEAIACSPEDAAVAQAAGVDRLEVCSALVLGGLTPSLGIFRTIRAATRLPLVAIVRPRASGFCYSIREFQSMLDDAQALVEAGADGLVFGILDEAGEIDAERCKAFVDRVSPCPTVFHRAFDATPEPLLALQTLIDVGVARVLTCGHAATALQGSDRIRKLIETAAGRIEVMAGGGVRPETVREIVAQSGVTQVHLGPTVPRQDPSLTSSEISSRVFGPTYPVADGETLAAVVRLLRA